MNTNFAYFPNQRLLFLGCKDFFKSEKSSLEEIQLFIDKHQGKYIFTALGYDLKNQIENITSNHIDVFQFHDLLLFVPEQVIKIEGEDIVVLEGKKEISEFGRTVINKIIKSSAIDFPSASLIPFIEKPTYIQRVKEVQSEIQYGNCYELNFCQQYVAKNVEPFDTFGVFQHLYQKTKSPFSVYFKFQEWEVLCLSPERFLQRIGNKLISQPIKGTIRRGVNELEDLQLQNQLKTDIKERSENIMIVDLVRNDLSKIATKGSVHVDELCAIYQFETLHHMISTISCEIKSDTDFIDCIKSLFPMGSMTGAPKKKVMQLIEKYEVFKRGLYSGSIGMILPNGDFDLNVVIRSLFYNNLNKSLSCAVGSAITKKADPEKEFDECGVKVGKLIQYFQS